MADPAPVPPLPNSPLLSLNDLAAVLAVPARWSFLRELARGETLPVSELGRRAGIPPNLASKNLMVLRAKGLVEQTYGRLYRLPATLRPDTAAGVLDLGHCLIRLDASGPR